MTCFLHPIVRHSAAVTLTLLGGSLMASCTAYDSRLESTSTKPADGNGQEDKLLIEAGGPFYVNRKEPVIWGTVLRSRLQKPDTAKADGTKDGAAVPGVAEQCTYMIPAWLFNREGYIEGPFEKTSFATPRYSEAVPLHPNFMPRTEIEEELRRRIKEQVKVHGVDGALISVHSTVSAGIAAFGLPFTLVSFVPGFQGAASIQMLRAGLGMMTYLFDLARENVRVHVRGDIITSFSERRGNRTVAFSDPYALDTTGEGRPISAVGPDESEKRTNRDPGVVSQTGKVTKENTVELLTELEINVGLATRSHFFQKDRPVEHSSDRCPELLGNDKRPVGAADDDWDGRINERKIKSP